MVRSGTLLADVDCTLHIELGAYVRIQMALQMGALRKTLAAHQTTEVLLATTFVSAKQKSEENQHLTCNIGKDLNIDKEYS